MIAISIDPRDTPATASEKRLEYTRRYSKKASSEGWHFLTGSEESIRAVTEAVGFHYRWDERSQMFFHASGIVILTPQGRIARYFYGVEYEPKDLKLGLVEAANGKIGTPVDRILLFCYRYDPASGKYTMTVLNLLRAAAAGTLAIFIVGLVMVWRRDLRADRATLRNAAFREGP